MASYDAGILEAYANQLYRRANTIIVVFTLFGGVVGIIVGAWTVEGFQSANPMMIYGLCALLFGALGYSIGSTRAFMLSQSAGVALPEADRREHKASGAEFRPGRRPSADDSQRSNVTKSPSRHR